MSSRLEAARGSRVLKSVSGAHQRSAPSAEQETRAITFVGDDACLVAALRQRHPAAIAAFHDRYARHMLKILVRILGNDPDLEDVHHDVFVRALTSIAKLDDPDRLTAWMVSVAVLSARTCLQRRYRGKWLLLFAPEDLPEIGSAQEELHYDALAELECTYELLDRLSPDERILFTLRFVEGMELQELAEACHVSLSTAKRRLKRAESRFLILARRHPLLSGWIEKGGRWSRA